MTMFPSHFSSSKFDHDGGFSQGGYNCFIGLGRGFSDLMAEDESRNDHTSNNEDVGSSSKNINNILHEEMNTNDDHDHGQWLQLSLGGSFSGGSSSRQPKQQQQQQPRLMFQVPEFRAVGPTTTNTFFLQPSHGTIAMNSVPMMTLQQQHQQQQQQQHQQETNYNYLQLIRPFPGPVVNPPVSSSSSFSGSTEQHGRPIHVHRRLNIARVVNPPRRPHSGVWFILQASQNQAKEPFLPQIPKSYLRIKDGRMTVGLLIKYLVNKLNLRSESEVEITCKGHQVLSISTLQHVRDTIWNSPRNDIGLTLFPQSSATSNHLMVLNYGRIA